ncbi:MAG TPA: LpqN/LpqT family lipoprotein [Isoptericola sp.]|nr:LpqN/LpqT family lipoprotein [Isoptericola sp.]
MSTLAYPSDQFPAFPAVSLDRPDGWSALPTPQAQLAIVRDAAGEFRANVVVVITRLLPDQTLETVAKEAAARLEALPGYEEVGRIEVEISGHPGFRIEGAWTTPDTGTVAQALRATVVEHHGMRDLVQITGTCSGDQVQALWETIRSVQDSVRITLDGAAG